MRRPQILKKNLPVLTKQLFLLSSVEYGMYFQIFVAFSEKLDFMWKNISTHCYTWTLRSPWITQTIAAVAHGDLTRNTRCCILSPVTKPLICETFHNVAFLTGSRSVISMNCFTFRSIKFKQISNLIIFEMKKAVFITNNN